MECEWGREEGGLNQAIGGVWIKTKKLYEEFLIQNSGILQSWNLGKVKKLWF